MHTSVDFVGIHLGTNDMFGQVGDAGASSRATITANYINTMVNSIKAYNANVKISILLTIPPSANQDAFGKDYSAGETRWRFKRSIDLLVKALISLFAGREAENIHVVPYNVNLDTKNNMSIENEFTTGTVAVNSRNSKQIVRQSNGVHPANSGYYQMADVLYYFIKSFEA
jgi:lysophospholipase L1-like esterase